MTEGELDPTALDILATAPVFLRRLAESVPEAAAEVPRDEGWSVKDVVAHLVDTEGVSFSERIERILAEERPLLRPIDPPARLKELGYDRRGLGDLLDELERRRPENVAWLRSLPSQQLARVGEHVRAGEISAANVAHSWAYHDLHHLKQMARMLQLGLQEHIGNYRLLYEEL